MISDYIITFQGSLFGLSSEHVQENDHITLKITCGSEVCVKTVKVKYLVMDLLSPYNAILGRPAFNLLRAVMSTCHLSLKYQLHEE